MTDAVAPMLTVLLALAAPADAASFDPELRWRTLETEHLRIHFHQGCEQVADELSVTVEDVYDRMTDEIGWAPRRRTEVTLVDRADAANGFATSVPYNAITLYVTQPLEDSSLNLYADWNTALFTHEFTHILHLDAHHGIVSAAQAIVGRIANTNALSPSWMVEGFATFQETRQTTAGRGRAPLADMILRTAAVEGTWPHLGDLDGYQIDVPSGNIRYLFGQDFLQWVADQTGEDVWTTWLHTYGSGLPYYLPGRRVFGRPIHALYEAWRDARIAGYLAEAERIRAQGETQGTLLSADPRANCQSPSYAPDGQHLVWSCLDNRTGSAIWMADGDGASPEVLLDQQGAKAFAWRRDGRAFAYAGTHTVNLFNSWSDVYLYELGGKGGVPLTSGARARDPEFSPDGQRLLVVTNRAQDNQLEQLTVDRTRTPLTALHDHTQIATPRFSPDGQRIAVSVWKEGRRDLWLWNPDGTPARRLTDDTAIDVDPAWSPDGRWLYFSSDRSGIPNVYAIELATERLWQVTQVVTGATRPTIRPDGAWIAWQQYSADGWDIRAMRLDPSTFLDRGRLPAPIGADEPTAPHPPGSPPATVARWMPDRAKRVGAGAPLSVAARAQSAERNDSFDNTRIDDAFGAARDYPFRLPPTPYNPLPTLPPRYLLPNVQLSPIPPRGPLAFTCLSPSVCPGLVGSLSTSGFDTLRRFLWSAYGSYRTDADSWSTAGSITYNRWLPVFSLSGGSVATSPSSYYALDPATEGTDDESLLRLDDRYWERRSTGTFTVSWPYGQRSSVFAQYELQSRTPLEPIPDGIYRPLLPLRGTTGALAAGYRYAWAMNAPYAISAEDGRTASLVGSLIAPWLGTRVLDATDAPQPLTQVRLTGDLREYLRLPWLANHVLALAAAGGITFGDSQYLGNYQLGGNYGDNAFFVTPSEYRMLRGYPFGADPGDMYWLTRAEYRLPLFRIDEGYRTFPGFLRTLSAAAFCDAGNAFPGSFFGGQVPTAGDAFGDALVGVGGELQLRAIVSWGIPINLRAGYAIGLTEGGLRPTPDVLAPAYLQFGGVF